MSTIAALYIDPRGPYPRMHGGTVERWGPYDMLDCWPASRDARLYDGPHPIVAHPPCKHWGRLAHQAHVECCRCKWHGKPASIPGLDIGLGTGWNGPRCPKCLAVEFVSEADCAPRAVEQVRKWGGVLEHPAGSKLWPGAHGLGPRVYERTFKHVEALPLPGALADCDGGYTVEVDQVEWGHVARKRTWLYLVGVPRELVEAELKARPFPGREPTHYASGGRTKSSRTGGAVPPGIKVCSAQQRHRTPPLFAEMLIRFARSVRAERRSA